MVLDIRAQFGDDIEKKRCLSAAELVKDYFSNKSLSQLDKRFCRDIGITQNHIDLQSDQLMASLPLPKIRLHYNKDAVEIQSSLSEAPSNLSFFFREIFIQRYTIFENALKSQAETLRSLKEEGHLITPAFFFEDSRSAAKILESYQQKWREENEHPSWDFPFISSSDEREVYDYLRGRTPQTPVEVRFFEPS